MRFGPGALLAFLLILPYVQAGIPVPGSGGSLPLVHDLACQDASGWKPCTSLSTGASLQSVRAICNASIDFFFDLAYDLNGNRLAWSSRYPNPPSADNYDLWLQDLPTGVRTRLTNTPGIEAQPALYGNYLTFFDGGIGGYLSRYDLVARSWARLSAGAISWVDGGSFNFVQRAGLALFSASSGGPLYAHFVNTLYPGGIDNPFPANVKRTFLSEEQSRSDPTVVYATDCGGGQSSYSSYNFQTGTSSALLSCMTAPSALAYGSGDYLLYVRNNYAGGKSAVFERQLSTGIETRVDSGMYDIKSIAPTDVATDGTYAVFLASEDQNRDGAPDHWGAYRYQFGQPLLLTVNPQRLNPNSETQQITRPRLDGSRVSWIKFVPGDNGHPFVFQVYDDATVPTLKTLYGADIASAKFTLSRNGAPLFTNGNGLPDATGTYHIYDNADLSLSAGNYDLAVTCTDNNGLSNTAHSLWSLSAAAGSNIDISIDPPSAVFQANNIPQTQHFEVVCIDLETHEFISCPPLVWSTNVAGGSVGDGDLTIRTLTAASGKYVRAALASDATRYGQADVSVIAPVIPLNLGIQLDPLGVTLQADGTPQYQHFDTDCTDLDSHASIPCPPLLWSTDVPAATAADGDFSVTTSTPYLGRHIRAAYSLDTSKYGQASIDLVGTAHRAALASIVLDPPTYSFVANNQLQQTHFDATCVYDDTSETSCTDALDWTTDVPGGNSLGGGDLQVQTTTVSSGKEMRATDPSSGIFGTSSLDVRSPGPTPIPATPTPHQGASVISIDCPRLSYENETNVTVQCLQDGRACLSSAISLTGAAATLDALHSHGNVFFYVVQTPAVGDYALSASVGSGSGAQTDSCAIRKVGRAAATVPDLPWYAALLMPAAAFFLLRRGKKR